MTPERRDKVDAVLARRQPDLTVLAERLHKPHNFAAILRTCDAVGVYAAHAIPGPDGLPKSNHTSQGAEKWVQVHSHNDATTAVQALKAEGYRLFAAHFSPAAVDFRSIDYTLPSCIVLGTELHGVSPEMLSLVDGQIIIPMQGMTQSLNVSVATAVILYEAQRQRAAAGLYSEPRLPAEQHANSRFEWLHPKVAQYCQERALARPELNEEGELIGELGGTS